MSKITILKNIQLTNGLDGTNRKWFYERCKSNICKGRRVNIGYKVSDKIWDQVIGDPNTVLCITCFDELAQDKNISYEILELFPITWKDM